MEVVEEGVDAAPHTSHAASLVCDGGSGLRSRRHTNIALPISPDETKNDVSDSQQSDKRRLFQPKKSVWDRILPLITTVLLVVGAMRLLLNLVLFMQIHHKPAAAAQSRATLPSEYLPYDPSIHKKPNAPKEKHHNVYRTNRQRTSIKQQRKKLIDIISKDSMHKACEWPTECRSILGSSAAVFFRLNTSKYVMFQNNLPFDRYVCHKVVLGEGGTLKLSVDDLKNCQERPRVFWNKPSVEIAKTMPPMRLVFDGYGFSSEDWAEGYEDESIEKSMEPFPNCSVPCYKSGEANTLSTLAVEGTNWEFTFSMEGPDYYSETILNPKSYQNDQYYAVTSFQSEVPLPYFSWAEYSIQHPPVDFDKAIKGASFLANNCYSLSGRENYVQRLMKESTLDVHSLGVCLHNAEPPAGVNMENKTSILERYLFHLAFENQIYDDYITEKMWGSLSSGTLPIYMGAPNVKDHVPPNSVIFADDFESPSDLAKFLVKLSNDKELYNSYHEWRQKPLNPEFVNKYNFTHAHSTCRVCKWAYAKKYGLGWNHTQQEITSLPINRRTCRNEKGMIARPFKEYWMSDDAEKDGVVIVHTQSDDRTCKLDDTNRQIFIDGKKSLSRTVYDTDGVTDLVIMNKKRASYALRLKFPIQAEKLRRIDAHKSILQDNTSRVTIVTKEEVQLRWSSSQSEIVDFQIAAATPDKPSISLNIRIIVETIDNFHEGAAKRVNYFGHTMTQDFLNPMDAYIIHES